MKQSFFILFFFVSISAISQKVFYVPESNDYSVLISNNHTIDHQPTTDGYSDFFYINDENGQFKYLFMVTKAPSSGATYADMFTDDFRNAYLSNCNCSIDKSGEREFNNFSGLIYEISSDQGGQLMKGYSITTVFDDFLISVNIITTQDTFPKYDDEYMEVVNSLVINK